MNAVICDAASSSNTLANTTPNGDSVTSNVSVSEMSVPRPCAGDESPFAAQSPKRTRNEIDADALGALQRIARAEALVEAEHADVERRFDRIAWRESTRAPRHQCKNFG